MSTDRTAEILNYLSAISREVGEMRAENNARFAEIDKRFEELRAEINTRFEEVNKRFEEVYIRLGRMEEDVRTLVSRLDRIESVVLKTRSEFLDERADRRDLEERVSTIERKLA